MTGQLRTCLLWIVVLNVVFVQITAAVSAAWMVPLFSLAIASPWMARVQHRWDYRLAWNVALLGIFALLILHIRQSGIRFMLEDGLILAAFCQVHVLNNLARQRRPDLILFNSFLIALVTGFFCQGVVYSVVFFVYAMVLVVTLVLAAASTAAGSGRELSLPDLRRLVQRSVRMGVVALVWTGLAFTFVPRDFDREGLIETDVGRSAAVAEVGFSEEVRLDRQLSAVQTDRIVLRAKLRAGTRSDVSAYWRGATFSNLHRRGWWAKTNPQGNRYTLARQLDEPWDPVSTREFVRPGHRTRTRLEVGLLDPSARSLFMPLGTKRVCSDVAAWPRVDGNFSITKESELRVYSIDLEPADAPPTEIVRPGLLGEHRRLDPAVVPDGVAALQRLVAARLTKDATQEQIERAVCAVLATERYYNLPGEQGAAGTFAKFAAGRGGGHCEYFATLAVILLRQRGVACRMVGGYLVHEWNESGSELLVRSRDAHAWVEVWDARRFWRTVDPTPVQDRRADAGSSLWSRGSQLLERIWNAVTGFDAKRHGRAWDALVAQVQMLGRAVCRPLWIALVVLVAGVLAFSWWHRARRAARPHPAVRKYLGAVARAGLATRPGESPRRLLERARREGLPEDRLAVLQCATAAHEQARYALKGHAEQAPNGLPHA
ncbi:MAG: DUF3488 domain-containing protein [Planctomycetes bacterium]|nr:DUF3488 domain-containing protein [Planctomycetota bacterium]MCB9869045.1 DUF3488 domain-containing protein [Planctomycetota bacterium]MCB9888004.1 DUF3488 domain-containing protein [Planctomycetota bacterium]